MVIQLRRAHTIKPRLEDSEMALFYFVFWRKSAHQYCARFSQEKKSRHWAVSVSFSILSSNVSCFPYNNAFHIQEWKILCISIFFSGLDFVSFFALVSFICNDIKWPVMETMQMNVSEWGQKKKKGAILFPYIVYLATFSTKNLG